MSEKKTKKKRKAVYNPEANKRWREKNKERNDYLRYKSAARVFIRDLIEDEDLEEFIDLLNERIEQKQKEQDIEEKND
jgi:hypothetical protein